MIKGIGIDIIELDRIQKSVERNGRFERRILTKNEHVLFERIANKRRKIEFLAGRFAAKEAFAKATGKGIGELSFQDIEVVTDDNGAPGIKVRQFQDSTILVSITHSRDYAVAQVVIEENN
ncbi:holo-[acyl-carrier-protein] synthase [Virgibacillus subterraneus]|uniref:Holo-[acyl-carrier-protein] synthase n=2 Tax=Virgibacillus TaxID=84406 RepID=A0A1H1FZ41_9BACI|nr:MULTISPECIES: holo-ACP synthase [Virgibacillus]SDR06247.1 holo-[acyl-carrier-protein] synthase [Virgibacillus salinus]SEQ77715.1 holo-[acyl-carrier-protein] synthase [Virgibacillus subterraneus]